MNTKGEFSHIPVLLSECLEALSIKPEGTYLDGTVGGAGHSSEIAKRLCGGRLYCLDKDSEAVAASSQKLKPYGCASVIEGDFRDSDVILAGVSLDGALLDLGVSSHQLDTAERGFSYNADGALDMRMSKNGITAADLINSMSWQELADIIRKYGEEPNAALIARKIAKVRETAPIETTMQLTQAIVSALPAAVRRKDKNPARKTFQAIRIAVNDELDTLSDGLEKIFGLLKPGGRFAVITFHSLEDRIVKQYFASLQISCTCPPEYPICTCGGKAKATAITKKPITATETENEENRRARSAKLRVIEKI